MRSASEPYPRRALFATISGGQAWAVTAACPLLSCKQLVMRAAVKAHSYNRGPIVVTVDFTIG